MYHYSYGNLNLVNYMNMMTRHGGEMPLKTEHEEQMPSAFSQETYHAAELAPSPNKKPAPIHDYKTIIVESESMKTVMKLAQKVARASSTAFLLANPGLARR